MTSPFTPDQSAEIDRRLVEMVTAAMGGEYKHICQDIADRRAEQFVGEGPQRSDRYHRMECLDLAVRSGANDPVALATEFEAFIARGSGDADRTARLECLKIAAASGSDDPASQAGAFAVFALGCFDA